MTQRVTIPDNSVFEGYGYLYRDEAEVPPPLQTASTQHGDGVMYCSLNNDEALRQLRAALRVDVPPQLTAALPNDKPVDVAKAAVAATTIAPHRWVYPPDAPPLGPLPWSSLSSSSSGTKYEIDRMKSQCRILHDWMMCHDGPEERVAAKKFLCTARMLLCRESVQELLGRTESLLQELEAWPAVVNAARAQVYDWSNDTTLSGIHEFIKDVMRTDEACARLAELMDRFSLVAPLVEEAAFRSAALEEIQEWSSESLVSSLQALQGSIHEWNARAEKDRQSIVTSSNLLLERITAIQNKRHQGLI
ncbi:putative RNA helicase [Trypanosoma grayi]|uniref:putative RNA helicase n=1 Tax=Trypanosoma grayi TaxID=71804 RepID=UPI0004F4873D|nr:putative RNA helicase [Trypanosoma grayi]KEG13719.1 putative RNA helicase [Trypanosoma grayi]